MTESLQQDWLPPRELQLARIAATQIKCQRTWLRGQHHRGAGMECIAMTILVQRIHTLEQAAARARMIFCVIVGSQHDCGRKPQHRQNSGHCPAVARLHPVSAHV